MTAHIDPGLLAARRMAAAGSLELSADPGPPEPPPDDYASTMQMPVLVDHLLSRSALRALPDPEPLIDNVLDQGTTALLFGRHGTWKTFIALDWAASVATGRRWQGRATHRTRVLYVVGEGAFAFDRRVDAWETGWGVAIGDDDFHVLPRPVNLTKPLDVANLGSLIAWNGYGLIVLDTLARSMVGADENSAKDGGIAIDAMTRLVGCTPGGRGVVLGVHHAGKDGKTFRGSSAFEAGADTVYSTVRDGAAVTLNREKRKDGPEYDRHELKLDSIGETGSCTISVHRGGGQTERGNRLLSTFVQHFGATGASKSELRNVAELSAGTFHRALTDLVQTGELVNHGTDQRPFYKRGE